MAPRQAIPTDVKVKFIDMLSSAGFKVRARVLHRLHVHHYGCARAALRGAAIGGCLRCTVNGEWPITGCQSFAPRPHSTQPRAAVPTCRGLGVSRGAITCSWALPAGSIPCLEARAPLRFPHVVNQPQVPTHARTGGRRTRRAHNLSNVQSIVSCRQLQARKTPLRSSRYRSASIPAPTRRPSRPPRSCPPSGCRSWQTPGRCWRAWPAPRVPPTPCSRPTCRCARRAGGGLGVQRWETGCCCLPVRPCSCPTWTCRRWVAWGHGGAGQLWWESGSSQPGQP